MGITGHKLTSVIDFDFIFNTDMGIYKYIRDRYRIPNIFNLDFLDSKDIDILTKSILREERNPLSLIATEDSIESIDSLYETIRMKYSKQILPLSFFKKDIIDFTILLSSSKKTNLGISILVNDEYEADFLLEKVKGFDKDQIIYKQSCPQEVLRTFDVFYTKDLYFFQDFGMLDIEAKSIYTESFSYNTKILKERPEHFEYLLDTNKVYLVNMGNIKEETKWN